MGLFVFSTSYRSFMKLSAYLLLFLPYLGLSQTNCLPEDCTRFTYLADDGLNHDDWEHQVLSGQLDTVINGQPYMGVDYTNSWSTLTTKIGAIRAVNDSVLYYSYFDSVERLIWDFNVSVGDTVVVWRGLFALEPNIGFKVVVDSVSYDFPNCNNLDSVRTHWYHRTEKDLGGGFMPDIGGPAFYRKKYGTDAGLFGGMYIASVSGGSFLNFIRSKDTTMVSSSQNCYVNHCNFPVSIDENETSNITLYPNPSSGQFWLSGKLNEIKKISIYSCDGKLLLNRTVHTDDNATFLLDCSDFNPGYYILRMNSQTQVFSKVLIIR